MTARSRTKLTEAERSQLVAAAIAVRENAYAPYSKFTVGAALLTIDDQTFTGSNVENASYGLGICAERSAFVAAVSAGHREFRAIAISSKGGVSPCGACRQFMGEFGLGLQVLAIDVDNPELLREWELKALLPEAFSSQHLR